MVYWGQAPGADNGACSEFSGVGVFTFLSPADGYKFIGAAFFSNNRFYVGDQIANNLYANWVWEPDGTLYNCGDTQATGFVYALQGQSFYSQLFTENTFDATKWQQVHV